jgi:hypothetical protein
VTIVQPPGEEQEQDRDLLRSRQKVMQQRNQLRKHLQAVLRRPSKKGNRLLLAGKHPNKVKVACAREMVGFVWESLNKAAA